MLFRFALPLSILPCLWNAALAQPHWTVRMDSVSGGISDMIWTGDRALAVDQFGKILSSPDGAVWMTQDSGGAPWSSIFRTATGLFLACSLDGSWSLSEDGRNWTTRGQRNLKIQDAAVAGKKTIASDWDTGHLFASEDDTTWVSVGADSQAISGGVNQINALASNGKVVVGVGHQSIVSGGIFSGDGLAALSADGETWRFRPVAEFPVAYRVRWARDRFFALSHGSLASSFDGEAWTKLDIPGDDAPFDLTWTGKQFVIVGGLGLIRVSADGTHWQPVRYQQDSMVYFNRAIWTGSRLVLAGIHQVAGKECRYIVSLDNDDLLSIRSSPSAPPRLSWEKDGDWLTARLPPGASPGRIRLFDLRGHTTRDIPFATEAADVRLPLSGLSRGDYVLRVESEAARPASFLIPR